VALQVHFPDTHAWLEPQVLQGLPPVPQALLVFPAAQLPWLSQQPLGQLLALQVELVGVHTWFLQASLLPQVLQAPPPVPQAASLVPGTQAPWAVQHPLAQVVASQVTDLHCWFSQMPGAQSWQVLPPVPQAPELVPGRHAPLKQHPLAQVSGPQGLALHAPATHCSSELQVTQTLPPLPQAASPVVSTHWLFWQQPVQLFGPQGSDAHWPFAQRSSAPQATHAAPPSPQVAAVDTDVVALMQAPLESQHP
jgi:hypothetical protein